MVESRAALAWEVNSYEEQHVERICEIYERIGNKIEVFRDATDEVLIYKNQGMLAEIQVIADKIMSLQQITTGNEDYTDRRKTPAIREILKTKEILELQKQFNRVQIKQLQEEEYDLQAFQVLQKELHAGFTWLKGKGR